MNGRTAFLHRRSQGATGLLLGLTLVSVGGCADLNRVASLPPVNPESPVAPAVAQAVSRTFPRPRLQDVPPAPRNVPTADAVKVEVFGIVRCRAAIRSYARSHPQIAHDAVVFAEDQRSVAMSAGDAPPADSAALSEDLAARLRAFAAPPTSIAAGPAPTPAQARPADPNTALHAAVRPAPSPLQTGASASTPTSAPMRMSAIPAGAPPPEMPPPMPDPLLRQCS